MNNRWRGWFVVVSAWLAGVAGAAGVVRAQTPPAAAAGQKTPGQRVAFKPLRREHPLLPVYELGREMLKRIEGYKDYSCTLIRRGRIGGAMQEYQYLFLKLRHEPFSLYAYTLAPRKGREFIFIAGRNDGKMWAHDVGARGRTAGTVLLDPEGPRARRESRRPITQAGIANLCRRMIDMSQRDGQFGECEVKYFHNAKIDGRKCLCIQVTHPVPRREFRFHIARIYVDDELQVPVRFEGYGWPRQTGGEPVLNEEYTYLNVKLNNGYRERDFDTRNPEYRFPR